MTWVSQTGSGEAGLFPCGPSVLCSLCCSPACSFASPHACSTDPLATRTEDAYSWKERHRCSVAGLSVVCLLEDWPYCLSLSTCPLTCSSSPSLVSSLGKPSGPKQSYFPLHSMTFLLCHLRVLATASSGGVTPSS